MFDGSNALKSDEGRQPVLNVANWELLSLFVIKWYSGLRIALQDNSAGFEIMIFNSFHLLSV